MKKFEVTFEGKDYDYVTRKQLLDNLKGIFCKADMTVKTIPVKKDKMEHIDLAHKNKA